MMKKLKKPCHMVISIFVIASIVLMPFSLMPKKADAQIVRGYVAGLAPAIARLPQCQRDLGNGIKKLFSGIGSLFSGETGGAWEDQIADSPADNSFEDIGNLSSSSSASSGTSVNPLPSLDELSSSAKTKATIQPISDTEVKKQLEKVNQNLGVEIGNTESINANSTCIASIGRLIGKMLLQKLTVSTVNWINSGFEGSPSFVQNPGKFFGDIAKNEILQMGIEINATNSPFGKAWMQNVATAYNQKFQDNAHYSLNELIKQTNPSFSDQTFNEDFSQGGWDAWTAMTQVPANNPLGFQMLASNELQKKLDGTVQSTAQDIRDMLKQSSGFLGDMRCSTDDTITQQQENKARAAGKMGPCQASGGTFIYVTPGSMMASAMTTAMNYQNNEYLNIQDLNDAIAAMMDAVLGQFSNNIYQNGLVNSDYTGVNSLITDTSSGIGDYRTQTEKDFSPSQLSSSWLSANPNFNIRTDLTQALVDEQKTYSDKLAQQNKELMSTTDGKDYNIEACPAGWTGTYPNCIGPTDAQFVLSHDNNGISKILGASQYANATCPSGWKGTYPSCTAPNTDHPGVSNTYGLIPAIYQLDYCIPGPHPGWENDSKQTLREIVLPEEPASKTNTAGEIANGVVGTGLNFVPYVGPFLGSLFGMITGEDAAREASTSTREFYTNIFGKLTGYLPQAVWGYGKELSAVDNNMSTSDGFFYVINSVFNRYADIMEKTYFSSDDMLPPIAKEAAKEFDDLPGYNQMIKDNNDEILSLKTTINTLEQIKSAVDELNKEYPNGGDKYENELRAQIDAFGRISADMVNGDDIAKADDILKQIIDKKNYIYNNLLKGPYGCEAWLADPANIKQFPSAGPGVQQGWDDWSNFNVNSVERMTYPFPIIYDYNHFAKGAALPDPWNSGYKTKMPDESQYDKYGPGFLSFIYFGASYAGDQTYKGSERLSLGDLVNDYDPGYAHGNHWYDSVSIGKNNFRAPNSQSSVDNNAGTFEKTIGIY